MIAIADTITEYAVAVNRLSDALFRARSARKRKVATEAFMEQNGHLQDNRTKTRLAQEVREAEDTARRIRFELVRYAIDTLRTAKVIRVNGISVDEELVELAGRILVITLEELGQFRVGLA